MFRNICFTLVWFCVLALCTACGGGGGSTAGGGNPDDGFSVTVLTNYGVREDVPLLNFAESLIQAICNAPAAGGC